MPRWCIAQGVTVVVISEGPFQRGQADFNPFFLKIFVKPRLAAGDAAASGRPPKPIFIE